MTASPSHAAVLLHEHGVGAGRHRRAGEDANRLAAHGRAPERVPGGSPPGAGQPRVLCGIEVVEEDRIAVDGGIVVRRHGAFRDHGLRQDAPVRRAQVDRLGLGNGMDDALKLGQRFRRRGQRTAEGEAVVAKLRH